MADFRKEALLQTLREEYGITSMDELADAIRKMKKLDITQFVLPPVQEGEKLCTPKTA